MEKRRSQNHHRNRHNSSKKLRKNPAAVFAALLILLSGFVFQLFYVDFFGESIPDKRLTLVNYAVDYLTNLAGLDNVIDIVGLSLIVVYLIIFVFYLLNGFGLIYNRYSRYASILTFVYLILGLISYSFLNQKYATSLFGFQMTSISIGFGVYFIPLVGLLYLIFKRQINSVVRF